MTRLFGSLAGYKPDWLRVDVIAGLTVWPVLVPEALAYATIAGVSPVGWQTWLAANNAAVMAVLFIVIGAKLIGSGLDAILA